MLFVLTIVLYKTIICRMKTKLTSFIKFFTLSLLCIVTFASCNTKQKNTIDIAVFIPGIMANSPTYALLDKGVRAAVEQYNQNIDTNTKATVYTMEAGTNQAQWQEKLTSLASAKKYDVIISSNSSLPQLALGVLEIFPNQKFIFLDATMEGNEQIATASYNQYEQSFLSGFASSLMSKNHKVAIIAAQEYPVMNNIIMPFFEMGAKYAYKDTQVDFRIVGNWYDANQGSLLADALINNGTDVILPICGGAAQGVINSAINSKTYISWFDNNGFDYAPGTIVSSSTMNQEKLAFLYTSDYLSGKFYWGQTKEYGMKEGFVDFIEDDANYINTVPQNIREQISVLVKKIKNGTVIICESGLISK